MPQDPIQTIHAVQDGAGSLLYADKVAEDMILDNPDDFGAGQADFEWRLPNGIHVVTWEVAFRDLYEGDHDTEVNIKSSRPVTAEELRYLRRGELVWDYEEAQQG